MNSAILRKNEEKYCDWNLAVQYCAKMKKNIAIGTEQCNIAQK